jgi:hypothetical protein
MVVQSIKEYWVTSCGGSKLDRSIAPDTADYNIKIAWLQPQHKNPRRNCAKQHRREQLNRKKNANSNISISKILKPYELRFSGQWFSLVRSILASSRQNAINGP